MMFACRMRIGRLSFTGLAAPWKRNARQRFCTESQRTGRLHRITPRLPRSASAGRRCFFAWHMNTPDLSIIGKKIHRLTVVSYAGKSKNNSYLFDCKCDCGNSKRARLSHLMRGEVKSCGCYRREHSRTKGLLSGTHRMCGTPTYMSWVAMKFRCNNTRHIAYPQYGGRGIIVCDRWKSFENFLADMGERPRGTTLDRIDSNGSYEPANCRWATRTTQGRNRRNNKLMTVGQTTLCLSEWAEKTGIGYSTIKERLRRNWTPEMAISPVPKGGAYEQIGMD